MFAVPKTITNALIIASLLLSGLAHADLISCFNFINAQDYARAESEAKQLLQSDNLGRVNERYAQLCLGRAYNNMGRNQDALPALQRVEALSQTTEELAVAYNWLGIAYANQDDLDRAELYDQRALKAFRELGNKQNEALTLNNLAQIAHNRNDTERALKLYHEALSMMPKAEQATTLNNIALIHNARKKYKQAAKLMRQAIEIDRSNGDAHATAKWQINLGSILRLDKQYAAAEKELQAGLNAIRLVGDKAWEATACETFGMLKIAKDNPKKDVDDGRLWMGDAEALYREIGDTANADRINNLLAGK